MLGKNWIIYIAALCLLCSILEARGGGRGGGGGGRGGGGRTVSRAPTMSRGSMDAGRSRVQDRNIDSGRLSQQSRQDLQRFAGQDRGQLDQRNLDQARQNLRSNWGDRQNAAQNIRNNLNRDGFDRRNLFNDNFWGLHHYDPYYRLNSGNLWRAATWAGVNGWLGYGWSDPYYYDSGYPVTVSQGSGTEYITQDDTPVQNAPPVQQPPASTDNWMPLGVFALSSNQNASADPTMFLQLVLGKDGTIAGSYYNSSTDQVYPITGVVDQATQKAVWKNTPEEGAPIFQTGIYNLTKDASTVSVTYSDGSIQDWFLVRIKDTGG